MPKRIFLVDDSKVVRQVVRTFLESRLDYIDCSEAVDGLDAIHRAEEVKPDLILIDLCMPLMNGLEAAASLHGKMPKVPIILFTLHKGIVSEARAKAAGIRAVISKSDQLEILQEEVLKHVGVVKAVSA